jgi:phosphopantothenoylcysteine decarboxylase
VRVHPRLPTELDLLPDAEAVLAAPLTFNTINRWAAGISDTLALGLVNESLGSALPIVLDRFEDLYGAPGAAEQPVA